MSIPESLEIVRDFVSRVLVAVFAFLVLGSAAIALNMFTSYADARGLLPAKIIYGLDGLEYLIFALDMVCFGYFLVVESLRFLKDVTKLLSKDHR